MTSSSSHGVARLADGGVEVRLSDGGTRHLRSRVILIATGSRPFRPADGALRRP